MTKLVNLKIQVKMFHMEMFYNPGRKIMYHIVIKPKIGEDLNEVVADTKKILTKCPNKHFDKFMAKNDKVIIKCNNSIDVTGIVRIFVEKAKTKIDFIVE